MDDFTPPLLGLPAFETITWIFEQLRPAQIGVKQAKVARRRIGGSLRDQLARAAIRRQRVEQTWKHLVLVKIVRENLHPSFGAIVSIPGELDCRRLSRKEARIGQLDPTVVLPANLAHYLVRTERLRPRRSCGIERD